MEHQKAEKCTDPFLEAPLENDRPRPANPHYAPIVTRTDTERTLGETTYDLQSNNSGDDRISKGPDGRVYGVWTFSLSNDLTATDRGTGYNVFNGGTWGEEPTQRVESVRVGWPSHVLTESGTEVILAHTGGSIINVARRASGSGSWEESQVTSDLYPDNDGPGLLWPRAAASGETIHMIAITTPEANAGVPHQGVDGHPLYYRSSDGGQSWDIVDAVLPGLDSTAINSATADGYAIHARGDVVTVAFFDSFADVMLLKSTDRGETWEKTILHDFPITKYQVDAGYPVEAAQPYEADHPAILNGANADFADSLALLSSDECGDVLIDHNGQAHVFWGRMYVSDPDLADGGTNFYPGTSGLMYWNESYGPDSSRQIVDVADINNNDTLDYAGGTFATYFASLTGQPRAGIDTAGNIYLAYTNVMETEQFLEAGQEQFYRHVFVTASLDGGESWEEPYDIINQDIVGQFYEFYETVFPAVVRDVDGAIDILYQQDFVAGLAVRGDEDEFDDNFINHVALNPAVFGIFTNTQAVQPEFFELEVQPNPAYDEALVSFDIPANTAYRLSLYDMSGRELTTFDAGQRLTSPNQVRIDVSQLDSGIYLVRLQSEGKTGVAKLVVK